MVIGAVLEEYERFCGVSFTITMTPASSLVPDFQTVRSEPCHALAAGNRSQGCGFAGFLVAVAKNATMASHFPLWTEMRKYRKT